MKKKEAIITNPTKLYTLVFLYKKPKCGYRLIQDFNFFLGKKLSPGQIYPLLKELVKEGLVEVKEEYTGLRKRKVYKLTEKGMKVCKDAILRLLDVISLVIKEKTNYQMG